MFNKLSLKIGMLFFVFILFIESVLFIFLYMNLANDRIDEVLSGLLAQGNSHRDVLEKNYDPVTLNHVVLMESETETMVVITDEKNTPIAQSNSIEQEMEKMMDHTDTLPHDGEIIADQWRNDTYIATESPIRIDGDLRGYVYMFAESNMIKNGISQLSYQFILSGILVVILTILMIFILTQFITLPLVRMKEATEKMSQGQLEITLGYEGNDELGQLESSIRKLAQDLEKLKQERNDFLASIAHELRTPLTYVKGYAEIANRDGISEEDRKNYLVILKEEADNISKLVSNLFELAKIDQNQFSINTQKIHLCDPIEHIVEKTRLLVVEKGIQLNIDCQKEVTAMIDPERFQQVLLNLLDNAIKHSHASSNITISVKEREKWIEVNVEDEGEGISNHHLPYIFDRLYRVDKSRSRKLGGTGLGLSIVKEIIEEHQGTMQVQSTVGKGTKITIQLKKGLDHG
ncbi:sensor histidine kinase [Salipaludibacillus sp. CF4.18]|uniref:sensor histidine kinase n=1 Tax=Salipaludibacillus sp. CF4.18 TaxID=3373081 RepID=UPI003EE78326